MTATQPDGGPRPGLGALLMLMGAGAQAMSYWSPNLGSRFGITWVLMAVGFVLMMRAAFSRIRQGRAVAGVLPVAAVVVVCAGTLLFARAVAAPTSGAENAVDDGERAAQQLRSIIEPQLDLIEANTQGPELLASWKSAAAQARQHLRAQMPLSEKRKLADYVIENSGSIDELEKKVREVWDNIPATSPAPGTFLPRDPPGRGRPPE